MLATVMNGSRQSWKESADGLTETVGAPSLREKRQVGRRWWTMRRSDGTRRRRPPRSVSLGRWGACGGRPHGRVDGDRVSRAMGGACCTPRVRRAPVCVSRPGDVAPVTINGAHRRPPARLRSRPWGSRPVRVPRTLHHRPPLPPLGESAVVDEVVLLVVIPPSPRFALPGLDAGVVGQSVTRFLPGSHRPAGTAPRPDRGSLRPPPSQFELQPLPGEPPSGSLTGTATTPGDAPRRPPIREIAG